MKEIYNSELLKKNSCIPQNFLPNYNGKETLEKIDIIKNLEKEKVRAELQIQKIRYYKQLGSLKQNDNDNEIKNLIKIISMKKLQ